MEASALPSIVYATCEFSMFVEFSFYVDERDIVMSGPCHRCRYLGSVANALVPRSMFHVEEICVVESSHYQVSSKNRSPFFTIVHWKVFEFG